ncbi:hypothetical protein B0H14DRAFT_3516877 [Mycena olivaceomarginata]|nr:hypothetical protein B0H14DRAFT_3516877 [Mycena olivaceomarginata]
MPAQPWATADQTVVSAYLDGRLLAPPGGEKSSATSGLLSMAPGSLTPEENKKLGDAITERKKQIATWFRYQKTKIGSANPGTNSAQSIKLDALVHALLQQKSHKPRRARQPIEVFQRRNRTLIRETLVAEGYDSIGGRDAVDDWTNESDGTEPALAKAVKAARMLQEEVEAEKEELREAEMREEEEAAERTPAQIQDGIDGLDAFYTKVHTAGHLATNICHGETVEGNDFEDSCVDFDKHIVEAFEGFLQQVFSAAECRASALEPRALAENDSSRPATVIQPAAPQAPAPASCTEEEEDE